MADRESLITENFGLVHACASRFTGRGVEYEDLYQIGCIGLIKAADGFDESRGLMFSTYAVPTILGEIKRIFRDGGVVKVSRSLKELSLKVYAVKNKLEVKIGREPTVGEIAEALGVSAGEVTEAICVLQPTVSLTVETDDGASQLDLPVCDDQTMISDRLYLDDLMSNLDAQEQRLIKLRYYHGKTQNETANLLCMTQVQVSRAEKRILAKLRALSA